MADLTQALSGLDADASAAAELLAQLNDRRRELAAPRLRHGRPAQTLQATDLVPEADSRLVDGRDSPRWESRAHCFAAAAEAMRRILIDPARRKGSLKHGGQFEGIANFFVRAASIAFFSERDRIEPESGRDAQARARVLNFVDGYNSPESPHGDAPAVEAKTQLPCVRGVS